MIKPMYRVFERRDAKMQSKIHIILASTQTAVMYLIWKVPFKLLVIWNGRVADTGD